MPLLIPTATPGTDMNDLASLFAAQQTNQIDWSGPLYSLYELPSDRSEFTVRFRSAIAQPPQGLRLKVRGGALEVGSTAAADLVLWEDAAPAEVHIRVRWNGTGSRSLRLWNVWRVEGLTQSWLGNAGMRVSSDEGGHFLFRCSDGEGNPDFDDLVAEVHMA